MGSEKPPSCPRGRERGHGRHVFWPTAGRRPALRFPSGRHNDGRGGFDTQSFEVEVSRVGPGEIRGTKFNDLNGNGVRDAIPPGSVHGSPSGRSILLLTGNGQLNTVGPQLTAAGFTVI